MIVTLYLKNYHTTEVFLNIELREAIHIFQKAVILSGFSKAKIVSGKYNKVMLVYNMFGNKNLERLIRKHGDDFESS